MRGLLIAAIVLLCAWSAYRSWLLRPVHPPPGVLVADEQVQADLEPPAPTFTLAQFTIEALASYHLRARLLHREPYHRGRESDLSPLDFAVGWGPMSDSTLLDQLEIEQSVRFFTLHWSDPALSESMILDHAANVHLIPADDTVHRALDKMRPGEIVDLQGYLVRVTAPDGWSWRSSLSRTDRGAGACELVWVERASSY